MEAKNTVINNSGIFRFKTVNKRFKPFDCLSILNIVNILKSLKNDIERPYSIAGFFTFGSNTVKLEIASSIKAIKTIRSKIDNGRVIQTMRPEHAPGYFASSTQLRQRNPYS